jgi:hypothetical protein
MTRHLAFIAVGEVVVNGQLLTRGDVPPGDEIDAFIFFRGFAVGFARVIQQGSHTDAIDHSLATRETEKVSRRALIVKAVSLLSSQSPAGVFKDPRPFLDRTGGETSAPMDGRGADLKTRDGFQGFHDANQILPAHGRAITLERGLGDRARNPPETAKGKGYGKRHPVALVLSPENALPSQQP